MLEDFWKNRSEKLKKPKTIDEQLDILKKRNLKIEDEEFAKEILERKNYYYFSGYLHPCRFYSMLNKKTKREIADRFNYKSDLIENWLEHMRRFRNMLAHNARLYNHNRRME